MDLKKNCPSKIQPPSQIKNTITATSLINIANASTPIRKRVLKTSTQMNSTPVNIHKIGTQAKSPTLSNKQNNENMSNTNKLAFKKPKILQKNLNLSPIMALNRKISEGPKLEQRCFTPTGHRRKQSLLSLNEQNSGEDYQMNSDYMMGDARGSNCFQTLLGSRAKTPTRIGMAESRQSSINSNGNPKVLRTSGSYGNFFSGGLNSQLRESKTNLLSSSGSFDSFRSAGTSQIRENEVACINEHEKRAKAKYKVIEENEQDEQMLVYCSRCAILLVKKGFKVEELTLEDIMKIKENQKQNHNRNFQYNEYYNYAQQTLSKLKLREEELTSQRQVIQSTYEKANTDLECYYNSIISLVEEQKAKDRQQLQISQEEDKNTEQIMSIKIRDAINQLESMMKFEKMSRNELETIRNLESLLTAKCPYSYRLNNNLLLDNIERKFHEFTQAFQEQFKLTLDTEDHIQVDNHQRNLQQNKKAKIPSDSPLRFSFEKHSKVPKNFDHNFTIKGLRGQFRDHNEQIEEADREDSGEMVGMNEKQAFRTLFPEQAESQRSEGDKNGIHSPTFKQF